MLDGNNETLMLVFVGLTGLAVLLQALVLFGIYLTVRKAASSTQQQIEELRSAIQPVLTGTQAFLTTVGPKLDAVATDLAAIAHGLRAQTADMQTSAADILEQVRRQANRLDDMLTHVLDTVDRAGGVLTETVNIPIRQLSAFGAFLRAAIGALRSGVSAPRPTRSVADKDLFV